jgi:hypothetical protein
MTDFFHFNDFRLALRLDVYDHITASRTLNTPSAQDVLAFNYTELFRSLTPYLRKCLQVSPEMR